jgi:hypothetical protein
MILIRRIKMVTKKEVYYRKVAQEWDNQCYALSSDEVINDYGEENVSKDYKPCPDMPIKEDK